MAFQGDTLVSAATDATVRVWSIQVRRVEKGVCVFCSTQPRTDLSTLLAVLPPLDKAITLT
jgi:hypothetical protein